MNRETIDILRELNNRFYQEQSTSFSQTRQTGWPGWERLITLLPRTDKLNVLDVACGNLRFEKFLCERMPATSFSFTCLDNCELLVGDSLPDNCTFRAVDVIEDLAQKRRLFEPYDMGIYDLVVSFGFMHHIPSEDMRFRFLDALLDAVKPGGMVVVSLWRFADNKKMYEKACRVTEEALLSLPIALERGDFLIGWNELPNVYRYCHSFSSSDVSRMVVHVEKKAKLVGKFRADGRSNELNGYIVITRR